MLRILRWVGVIALLAIVSKVLGFGREASLAAFFGASGTTDAYLAAMTVPYLLFGIVNMSIETAVIPIFSAARSESDEDYQRLVWTIFHLIFAASVVLVVVGTVFAPAWVPRIVPGFPPERMRLAVWLSRLLLPMLFFQGFAAWAKGLLQSRQQFLAPAAAGIPFNLISMMFILVAARWGADWLAIGTVLAMAGQFVIQIPALYREGLRYRLVADLKLRGLRDAARIIPPVLIGVGAEQFNFVVNRILASGLAAGRISALNFAERSLGLSQGIVGLPLINVLYSELARHAASGDMKQFWKYVERGLLLIGFCTLPIMAYVLVLAPDITRMLFQRGVFTASDTALTSYALFFYAFGIPFLIWRDFLSRAFYSLQDAVTPLKNGLWMVALNVALNLLLIRPLSHGGLALGNSMGAACGTIGLFIRLYRRNSERSSRAVLVSLARMATASAAMAWCLHSLALHWLTTRSLGVGLVGQCARLLLLASTAALIYLAASWLLRSPELIAACNFAINRMRTRRTAVPQGQASFECSQQFGQDQVMEAD